MPEEIIVRQLQQPDAQEVYEVALAAWQYTYRNIYSADFINKFVTENYAPAVSQRLLPHLQARRQFFAVACSKSGIVGFCHISETKQGMELLRMYLRPTYIGQGIGRQLLEEGEGFIRSKEFSTYCCFVHQDNELGKNFYIRNGFKHLIAKDTEDAWYLEKRLERPEEQFGSRAMF